MAENWFILRDDKKYGKCTSGQLKQLADSGQLLPIDMVQKDGMTTWVSASQVKGLLPSPVSVASPPVVPEPEEWHLTQSGKSVGPVTWAQLQQQAGRPVLVGVDADSTYCYLLSAEDHCDADNWDHVAFDPEHRLVVSVVPGKRTEEKTHPLVQDFKERTGGRLPNLLTSDEYPVQPTAIFEAYAVEQEQPRTGRPGRPKKPKKVLPKGPTYATVHKERENGRVKKVTTRVVFGTKRAVLAALARS